MATHEVEVRERLDLIHALCQYVADSSGVDILAVKGAVAREQFTARTRIGTDVDVLVRPGQADRFVEALTRGGWTIGRDAHDLDLSNHAVVLEHPLWGLTIDVHRHFPGFSASPTDVFRCLWAEREYIRLGGRNCAVPKRCAHGAVLIVNAARNPMDHDARLVHDGWTSREFGRSVTMVHELGGAQAAATRLPELFHPERRSYYWQVVSNQPTGTAMWLARIWDTPGVMPRLRLLAYALVPPPLWGERNGWAQRLRRTPEHWAKGLRQLPGAVRRLVRMAWGPRRR